MQIQVAAAKLAEEVDSDPTCEIVEQAEISEFEVAVEAQKEANNDEIIGAIEVNLDGCLHDQNVDLDDQVKTIYIHREIPQNIPTEIRDTSTYDVESWRLPGGIDDLAFTDAAGGSVMYSMI